MRIALRRPNREIGSVYRRLRSRRETEGQNDLNQGLTDLPAYPEAPVFDASKTHRVGIEICTTSGRFLPTNTPANNAPVRLRAVWPA